MDKFIGKMLKEIFRDGDVSYAFRWKILNGEYTLEITDSRVKEFLKLILVSKQISRFNDTSLEIDNNEYERFVTYFTSSATLSLLKDALSDLSRFFFKKRNRRDYPDIFAEVFFESPNSFEHYITSCLSTHTFGMGNESYLLEKSSALKSDLYYIIPKLTQPVHLFAMSYTIDTLFGAFKEYPQIIKKRSLPLFKTAGSVYSHFELYQKAQKDFKSFMGMLNKDISSQNGSLHNNSLNLFMLNELTNLYDLYKVVDLFKESRYMYFGMFENKNDSRKSKEKHRADLEYYFNNLSAITKSDNLGLKSFILNENYFNVDLVNTDEFWDISKSIIDCAKESLAEFIKKESDINLNDVPTEIRAQYGMYLSFAYKNELFLDEITDICNVEIPIYKYNEDNLKELAMFEAYGYGYRAFYNTKNSHRSIETARHSEARKSKVKLIIPFDAE